MNAACVAALLAGSVVLPAAVAAPTALAAETCRSAIPTYVHDTSTGSEGVLRKYLDWDPLTGNAAGSLLDTGVSAPLDRHSRYFTSGNGIIYVITPEGALQLYRDETATGGDLLTFVRDMERDWSAYSRVWSSGNRIYTLGEDGVTVYLVALSGTVLTKLRTVPSTDPAVQAMAQADDVWAAGGITYTLKRGVADQQGDVKAWPYSDTLGTTAPFSSEGSTTVIRGIGTKTRSGWSPGPGTIYTLGDTPDYTGIARSYTGSQEMSLANEEVAAGLYGDVQADLSSCLASPSSDDKPEADAVPPETETPPLAVTDETADPAPQDPTEFSGKFVLGDGTPAAGLPVDVEATDVTSESEDEVAPVILGSTVTAADGTWSLPLPQSLPAEVQQAAAANGGAINATASVDGQTASGQIMLGTDAVSAAPASASSAVRALVSTAAEDTAEPSKLRPMTDDMLQETPEPTEAQTAQSWGSKNEAVSVDTLGDQPLPEYQSDTGALPQDDPYVIDGVDTKSMVVTPMDGGCDKASEKVISKNIYYTAVGEGHAYWDAKASVDYDSKLSSSVEVAVKTGTKWTIEGSVTLGSSMSATTGYTNKGPYFAKQWKVPIEYKKTKEKWVCNYGRTVMYRYKIKAGKYKVPSGGAVGKYGKDVSSKDGMTPYKNSPKSHRAYVEAGTYFQISKNRSIKWSGAVSAYGVKLGGSTQYDKDHRQRITAGNSKKYRHDIWGKNDRVSGKPGVFYSF
ncbi:hypothetical protein [Streptomyces sp. NPDC090994]|uniref:hypothetical protein n=1 Tax=Streptomyces sp. NPDC090994 TaxID=3365969 RepID=UPI00380612C0